MINFPMALGDRITNNNVFEWVFGRDIETLRLTIGPLDVTGRGVYFFYVVATLLAVVGVIVLIVRKQEITQKWITWAGLALFVGIPMWIGQSATVLLAVIISTIAVWEFSRLVKLPKPETYYLHALAILYPISAYYNPDLIQLVPFFTLLCAVPTLLVGDVKDGLRRTTMAMFGSIWICWSLAFLVIIWKDAFLVLFVIALADVGAWCGGKLLRKYKWGRHPLSPLSPNKTMGGLLGGLIGATIMLSVLGSISWGLVLAIGLGATLGDLLESMVKRQVGVKDAGNWLPGFGGLLDRIDSWLLVLPLAAVLGTIL